MAQERTIDITIAEDGMVKIDQVGYEGKSCEIDPLLKAIKQAVGQTLSQVHKADYYRGQKVRINAQAQG